MNFLCIPKNKIPYSNGYTTITEKNIWSKYENDWMYIDETKYSNGFNTVSPFLIFTNQFKEFLVNCNNDLGNKYSLSVGSDLLIKEEYGTHDAIFKFAFNTIQNCPLSKQLTIAPLKHIGYIKDVLYNPNHISIAFIGDVVKMPFNGIENYKWMSKNELIESYGKFDSLSKHYIDFLAKEILNGK